jgi:glycerophosphoryl diester phosphodiesterase
MQRWRQLQTQTTIGYIVTSVEHFLSRLPATATTTEEVLVSEYRVLLSKPDLVSMARKRGMDVVAWTVDSRRDWEKLAAIGVSRMVTNVPGDVGGEK